MKKITFPKFVTKSRWQLTNSEESCLPYITRPISLFDKMRIILVCLTLVVSQEVTLVMGDGKQVPFNLRYQYYRRCSPVERILQMKSNITNLKFDQIISQLVKQLIWKKSIESSANRKPSRFASFRHYQKAKIQ